MDLTSVIRFGAFDELERLREHLRPGDVETAVAADEFEKTKFIVVYVDEPFSATDLVEMCFRYRAWSVLRGLVVSAGMYHCECLEAIIRHEDVLVWSSLCGLLDFSFGGVMARMFRTMRNASRAVDWCLSNGCERCLVKVDDWLPYVSLGTWENVQNRMPVSVDALTDFGVLHGCVFRRVCWTVLDVNVRDAKCRSLMDHALELVDYDAIRTLHQRGFDWRFVGSVDDEGLRLWIDDLRRTPKLGYGDETFA